MDERSDPNARCGYDGSTLAIADAALAERGMRLCADGYGLLAATKGYVWGCR
jgi:hypothetical protein